MFDFLLDLPSSTGALFLRVLAGLLRPLSDTLAAWLLDSDVQYALAALFTLALHYLIGLLASVVVSKKPIATIEDWVSRLPLVQTIHGATKCFLQTVSQPPGIELRTYAAVSMDSSFMPALQPAHLLVKTPSFLPGMASQLAADKLAPGVMAK